MRTYLPDFRVEDEAASAAVTVRQLLNHTADFEGDIFRETGNGDDASSSHRRRGDVPQLFPPGEQFSYNNLAFCLLGRLVEVLREKPYKLPARAPVHPSRPDPRGRRRQRGDHVPRGDGPRHRRAMTSRCPRPLWGMMRSGAPAGSLLSMPPRDLLAFAKMHLNDGKADDGTVVLSPESVRAMRDRQVELPKLEMLGDAWGLGWEIMDTDLGTMIGHDGNTIGQASFLRVLPEHGIAISLLTNGGNVYPLYREIFAHVLGELGGPGVQGASAPPENPERIDASAFVGTYGASVMDLKVSQDDDGRIFVDMIPKGMAIEMGDSGQRSEYVPSARTASFRSSPPAACSCRSPSSATTARATPDSCTSGVRCRASTPEPHHRPRHRHEEHDPPRDMQLRHRLLDERGTS